MVGVKDHVEPSVEDRLAVIEEALAAITASIVDGPGDGSQSNEDDDDNVPTTYQGDKILEGAILYDPATERRFLVEDYDPNTIYENESGDTMMAYQYVKDEEGNIKIVQEYESNTIPAKKHDKENGYEEVKEPTSAEAKSGDFSVKLKKVFTTGADGVAKG